MLATFVSSMVISGVGAVPWVERADGADDDGGEAAGPLEIVWGSLAGGAGAAVSGCRAPLVLDGGLCKTPSVESVAETLACAQDGFELVSAVGGELGVSHSCQRAVEPYCPEGKVLHEGMCRTAAVSAVTLVEQAVWSCAEGVLETVTDENGTTRRCRVELDPPVCPDGETYETIPSVGCYASASVRLTAPYEPECEEGFTLGHGGEGYVCTKVLDPPVCPDGETYETIPSVGCYASASVRLTAPYEPECEEGFTLGHGGEGYVCTKVLDPPVCPDGETYETIPSVGCYASASVRLTAPYEPECEEGFTLGHGGEGYVCTKVLDPPVCPDGETYETIPSVGCYASASVRLTAPYEYSCRSGFTLGHGGEGYVCTKAVDPYCAGSLTYRLGACYSSSTSYGTAPYEYSCRSGFTLGHGGEGYVCTKAVDPYCAGSLTYRLGACYSSSTSYGTAPYEYSCRSGFTLGHGGEGYVCTKAVDPYCAGSLTYRLGACYSSSTSYRTAPYEYSCESDYELDHTGEGYVCSKTETYQKRVCSFDPIAGQQCWYETRTRVVTEDPTKECPSGYSPNGAHCRADAPTTTWTLSSTRPVTTATASPTRRCPPRYSPNGANCRADTPSTTWTLSSTRPVTTATASPTRRCPPRYSPNGANCRADTPSTTWTLSSTRPVTTATASPTRRCPSGYSPNGANCRADAPSTVLTLTGSAPATSASTAPAQVCPSGYSPNGANCRADAPSTVLTLTGSAPATSASTAPAQVCPSGYSPNGANCRADAPSTVLTLTGSAPATSASTAPAQVCPSGYSPNGANCRADAPSTVLTLTGSAPTLLRDGAAPWRLACSEGYAWSAAYQRCEKPTETTVYTDPTVALTAVVGDAPRVSCPQGYLAAGGGRCERTVLGEPTQLPTGDDCAADLGTLGASTLTRAGTWTAGCAARNRGSAQLPNYGFRYLVRSGVDATLTVGVSSAVDAFVYLADANGAVVGSDDDSGTGRDALLSDVAVTAGTSYVIEATTAAPRRTGAFTLTVTAAAVAPDVVISGLSSGAGYGTAAAATAADSFDVEPDTATCTAATTPAAPRPRVTAGTGGQRTVSVTAAAPFSRVVTVACDAEGRTAAEADTTLEGHIAVSSLAVAAATSCVRAGAGAYTCTVPRNGTVPVTATAQGAHPGLSLAWAAAGGAAVAPPTHTAVAPLEPSGFTRSSTAALSCTADGTVTVAAAAAGAAKTAAIAVECLPAETVCNDPIGALPAGVTVRTGEIAANSTCTSTRRSTSSLAYYARRHTFSLERATTVTMVLEGVPASRPALDLYVLLLAGRAVDGSGALLHSNDDQGPGHSSHHANSRLAAVSLAAGDYTIEATTFLPARTGAYSLTITGPPVSESIALAVVSGGACSPAGPAPSGVDHLWDCQMSSSGSLRVLANARSAQNQISHAWTAAAGVTAGAPVVHDLQDPDDLDSAYRKASTATLGCTASGTADLTVTYASGDAARTRVARLAVGCLDPVLISGLSAAAGEGEPGTSVAVPETFTVSPAAAECTAAAADSAAAPTVTTPDAARPAERVVSAEVTVGSSRSVTVACSDPAQPQRTPATRSVSLTATLALQAPSVTLTTAGACTPAPAAAPTGADAAVVCDLDQGAAIAATFTAVARHRRHRCRMDHNRRGHRHRRRRARRDCSARPRQRRHRDLDRHRRRLARRMHRRRHRNPHRHRRTPRRHPRPHHTPHRHLQTPSRHHRPDGHHRRRRTRPDRHRC